jgi:hypothetical protein
MVSDETLKKLQEQIAAWPMTQRFVVQQLIEDYLRNREDVRAHEATGLTAEEVSTLVKDWTDLCTIVGECGGITRVKELAEADKDGRLVVLPCNVGDTVYRIFNPPSREPVISAHTLMSVDYIVRWIDKFGKTVFLTREEAEKALEAMKDE